MIDIHFVNDEGAIVRHELMEGETLPPRVLWIDLLNPGADEKEYITKLTGVKIPSREEVWKNETLNRFYEEDGLHYMTAAIITRLDTAHPNTSAVTFVLSKQYLLTMRYIIPTSFAHFAARLMKSPQKFTTGARILEGLLEEIIGRVAYNSEKLVNGLDELSHQTFNTTGGEENKKPVTTGEMKTILKNLGNSADLNSKINESLHSLSRLVHYLAQVHGEKELNKAIRTLSTDTDALIKQTGFLSNKITFLLDATLGLINAEQNTIIKIFSVMTAFFLPPMLLTSVYGMNFEFMPELHKPLGYPAVLIAMGVCVLVPYLYFRRKRWL